MCCQSGKPPGRELDPKKTDGLQVDYDPEIDSLREVDRKKDTDRRISKSMLIVHVN